MRIGLLRGMRLCAQYRKMDETQRVALQMSRLREMVDYARANSPLYQELYRNLPENWSLGDLPPVNKRELMARFDEWPTDRSVRLDDLNEYMRDLDHVGRKFHGKYLVFTTSGSTGNPLVALCDDTTNNVMGAVNTMRSITRAEDLRALMLRGGKTIGVFATGGFYLSNSSIRARLLAMPWKKRQMALTSALLTTDEIVAQLNAFQPAMLGGYPSQLDLLVDEQKSGRLKIKPVLIMTGGEYLSEHVRTRLSEAFGCYVQTSYSCTEAGTIACECTEHHFHINEDWVLVEPVDAENRPVPDGTQSDKILVTNLFNFTQPFLRYEITDRVVRHSERCACGNPLPWLTLEGRTDDVLTFSVDGGRVKVAPLSIYAVLKEVHAMKRFQLLAYPDNQLELRLEPAEGIAPTDAFEQAKQALFGFLATQGVNNVSLTLSQDAPKQQAGSGKFKHIVQMEPQSK